MDNDLFMFPASFAQRRLWFLDQMAPGTASYNISKASRFSFPLNIQIFRQCLNEIANRHDSLRTTFKSIKGQPFQVVASSIELELAIHDLTHLPANLRERTAQQLAVVDANGPFNLETGPLVRTSLIKINTHDHIFLMAMHHIISDVWSVNIFFTELTALYESFVQGKPSPLPPLPLQYADFAVWQIDYLSGDFLEKEVNYWKHQLSDLPSLELPLDKKRPSLQSFKGEHKLFEMSSATLEGLKRINNQENVTLFMTLLSAFVVLLHKYSNQNDIAVGVPIAGRNQIEIEGLIGFFVNSIIIRTKFTSDMRFVDLLNKVRLVFLDSFAHGDVPFEKLVEELHPARDLSKNPLFQVLFQMGTGNNETTSPHKDNTGIDVKVNTSKFDLTLSIVEEDGKLIGNFEYNSDLFFPATIQRMIDDFVVLLQSVIGNPTISISELSVLTSNEKKQLLIDWNDNINAFPSNLFIDDMLNLQANELPDHCAIFTDECRISYAELNTQVNQLANLLLQYGAGPEVIIAVLLERSVQMVIAHLAILKAGSAFMALDPTYPEDRITFMLADSQAAILITDKKHEKKTTVEVSRKILIDQEVDVIAASPKSSPAPNLDPQNRAYVMYTSGSTGKPKGVELTHKGLNNLIGWQRLAYGITHEDRSFQLATPAYDAYVYEIFPSLASGATIYMVDDISRTSPDELREKIVKNNITICFLPTALAESVVNGWWPEQFSLRVLGTAGEKLVRVPQTELPFNFYNLYGPTENTVIASYWPFRPIVGHPPIGRPVSNVSLYVLDSAQNLVPIGVVGELYIGGEQLARGYLNRPGLTAEKFIPDPFSSQPGRRLYRTGDLVRYLSDGNIEFIGRIDHQIKLRGFRIELEEIESILYEISGVKEAAVVTRNLSINEKMIAAYISLHSDSDLTADEVKSVLKNKLPNFMLPTIFIVNELPKSFSGKIDRKLLPDLEIDRPHYGSGDHGPETTMEEMIYNIWKEFLPYNSLNVLDNFFDAGGHSLMMAQIHHRLKSGLNTNINLIDLFQYPSIRSLAKHLESVVSENVLLKQSADVH